VQITKTIKDHKVMLAISAVMLVAIPLVLIAASYYTISPYRKFVRTPETVEHTRVGLVLGAGVSKEGKPYNELKARLDSAADALNKGIVDKVILSGDNRYEHYDEPGAMRRYMVEERNISMEKVVADYAGRSTYESCERASKVFGVNKLIIFSANSHLPRAIYLCKHFNVEAYGVASGTEANNSTRRELLARVKAVYNAHIMGEKTVLGEPVSL
jgi:vancomycin permeability regulator SanA